MKAITMPTEEMATRLRNKLTLLQYAFMRNEEIPAYMNDVFYFELEDLRQYLPSDEDYALIEKNH